MLDAANRRTADSRAAVDIRANSASSVSSSSTRRACAATSPTGSRNPSTPSVTRYRNAARVRRHGHDPASHPFQRREAECFKLARLQQHVRLRNQPLHVVLFAEKGHVIAYAQVARQQFRRTSIRPIPGHQQMHARVLPNLGQDPDAVEYALHRPEI